MQRTLQFLESKNNLTDTITKALSDAEANKEGQETDVSLSLANEEVPELQECEDQTRPE